MLSLQVIIVLTSGQSAIKLFHPHSQSGMLYDIHVSLYIEVQNLIYFFQCVWNLLFFEARFTLSFFVRAFHTFYCSLLPLFLQLNYSVYFCPWTFDNRFAYSFRLYALPFCGLILHQLINPVYRVMLRWAPFDCKFRVCALRSPRVLSPLWCITFFNVICWSLCMKLLTKYSYCSYLQGTSDHYYIGLKILNQLVVEMNQVREVFRLEDELPNWAPVDCLSSYKIHRHSFMLS